MMGEIDDAYCDAMKADAEMPGCYRALDICAREVKQLRQRCEAKDALIAELVTALELASAFAGLAAIAAYRNPPPGDFEVYVPVPGEPELVLLHDALRDWVVKNNDQALIKRAREVLS